MLKLTQLALRRGPKLLLEGVNLQIHPGQKVGITGANGSGKSSLFSLILGEIGADGGDLTLPRDWVIAHVAQETPSGPRPAIEYVLDGDAELRQAEEQIASAEDRGDGEALAHLHGDFELIDGYTARSRAAQLLHGLGFTTADEARPVTEFSGGWRMRLNLARALMCRSSLLLLDEPTNHLDLDTVIWLETWLRAYPGTLLLISHDRDFLDAVAQYIVHFDNRHATLYTGNYSAFERLRAERLALQQSQYRKQQREIAHMRSFVDRFRAKASKARQAQSRIKALERMEMIAPAHVDSPFHFSLRPPEKLPNPLLRIDDASAGYGGAPVFRGVRLTITPGDRIGLLGANGAGKSTLIKLVAGMLQPSEGERVSATDLKIGYFAQHQVEQLDPERSPLEHFFEIEPTAREMDLRNYLGGFGFSSDSVFMNTGPFSGGERSRLALALLVYRRPNLLLLDEPANHLDLEMRQALSVALQEFPGAMMVVSHDRHLLRVTTDQLVLVHAGSVDDFDGSLDDYPAWLAAQNRADAKPSSNLDRHSGVTSTESLQERKERKRREAAERQSFARFNRRAEKAEAALAEAYERKKQLEERLADSALYEPDNKEKLRAVLAEQADLNWALAKAEAEWLEATEALERVEQEAPEQERVTP